METNYLNHILYWMGPVILIQWVLAGKVFLRNLTAVFIPPLVMGTYYSLADIVAISSGIWYFDENQILGVYIGPIPLEEVLFFFITALLVSQSFVMFLPRNYRR